MISAEVPRTELDQTVSRRAYLLNQQNQLNKTKNLTIQQRARLLNENAVGTVLENLQERFLLADTASCDGENYALYVHPELNLVGIYSYKLEQLLVIGEVELIRPHWTPLIYNHV